MISVAGGVKLEQLVTMDLHAGQIQGFFNLPVNNIFAMPILLEYIKKNWLDGDLVIVSPDTGGMERARAFAKRLGDDVKVAAIDKRRAKANESEVMNIVGDVAGCTAVLLDDMVDTAGTLTKAATALVKNGAKEVRACASHPVLSGPAMELIITSPIKQLVITDTIPIDARPQMLSGAIAKIKVLTVAPLLGEAIKRIHHEDSVSSLFV
jgi:ribose-phosphate pyrophosphokinase